MAASVPTTTPATFTAGDTLKFTRAFGDYLPADNWVLTYTLVNASAKISFAASDNGDGSHLVNVAPATTAAYTAGTYDYQARVDDGTDSYQVETGHITIYAEFDAQTTYDARPHAEKALASIEAVLEDRATESDLSYSIGARSLSKMTLQELQDARDYYKREVRRIRDAERRAAGKPSKNIILQRFN